MEKVYFLIASFSILSTSAVYIHTDIFLQDDWCYGLDPQCGEPKRGGLCTADDHQTPIDLPAFDGLPFDEPLSIKKDFINLKSYTIINNGLSLIVDSTYDTNTERPRIFVPHLKADYLFKSFHFHWGDEPTKGSEHSIQGKFFAGEVHLLFFKESYPLFHDALMEKDDPGSVLVISVFITPSSTGKLFSELEDNIPLTPGNVTVIQDLDLSGVFQGTRAWEYLGSSSVPPCYEDVSFIILDEPVEIGENVMTKLREMKNRIGVPVSNNFKKLVPLRDQAPHQLIVEYAS